MSKNFLILNSTKLDYDLSDSGLSSLIEIDSVSQDVPSVSYLNSIYENELLIPVSIFKSKLAPLQTVVKYLKEHKNVSNKKISKIIGRDLKTIWLTYNSVENKKVVFDIKSQVMIPASIIKKEKSNLSALEKIVFYLKEKDLGLSEIAKLLDRDPRTIWTVYSRTQKKIAKVGNNK